MHPSLLHENVDFKSLDSYPENLLVDVFLLKNAVSFKATSKSSIVSTTVCDFRALQNNIADVERRIRIIRNLSKNSWLFYSTNKPMRMTSKKLGPFTLKERVGHNHSGTLMNPTRYQTTNLCHSSFLAHLFVWDFYGAHIQGVILTRVIGLQGCFTHPQVQEET